MTESAAAAGLRALLNRLVTRKVINWTDSNEIGAEIPETALLTGANIVTSVWRDDNGQTRHALVLDIDHPSWLVKSSTEGHFHLYVDVPSGIPHETYIYLLGALQQAGVIQPGYNAASERRGFTSVRLPWIKKGSA